jgi:dolichyl-phosphate-mannose-protein mannosyltransferase
MKKIKLILIIIILFTTVTRLYRLDYPTAYVFDEVYHGFTAKEYLKANRDAWNPFATPPKGVAYEWLHPPISKEIMTASMFLAKSTDAWAYRLPGALLGIMGVYLMYLIGIALFKKESIGLLAAFIYSIEGLVFVQSRTGMNDAYLTTFVLASLLFFIKQRFLMSSLLLGIAMATKWPGIYLLGMYILLLVALGKSKKLLYFFTVPPIIYLLSYVPYFLQGYTVADFIELNKQIWWYQTNLKATHDYASAWWSWPLNLYPVWYFVDYVGEKTANIFASGNPVVFWFGLVGIILTIWEYFKSRSDKLLIIILGYLIFWLPWALSPRIMFLYHYSPSVPFLSLALAYQLNKLLEKQKNLLIFLLILMFLGFVLIFPFLTGLPLPKDLIKYFFYTNLTKNPF